VQVDKRNDVCKYDGVVGVDQDRSVKRLEEDEDRLSSSSIVYMLLPELRLELTGRGPCRQLPARRRDIVGMGEVKESCQALSSGVVYVGSRAL